MRQTSLVTQLHCHDITRIVAQRHLQRGSEIEKNNKLILVTILLHFNLIVGMPKS